MVPQQAGLPHGPRSSLDPPSAASCCSASVFPPSSSFAGACDDSVTLRSRASGFPPDPPSSPVKAWIYRSLHRPTPTRTTTTPFRRTHREFPAAVAVARLHRPTHMQRRMGIGQTRRRTRARPRRSRRLHPSYSAHAHQSPGPYSKRAYGLRHQPHRS